LGKNAETIVRLVLIYSGFVWYVRPGRVWPYIPNEPTYGNTDFASLMMDSSDFLKI
jgi:hypothetical protein